LTLVVNDQSGPAKPNPPEKLTKAHDRMEFESGATELDEWLRKYSWQNQRANNATTYVSTYQGRVVGYYAITVAGYERSAAPEAIAKRAPESVPCFLLARLAADIDWQGRGLGSGLLSDALRRVLLLSESVAAPALLVHARDEAARDFYLRQAEFLQSPVEPLHLLLPMKTIASEFELAYRRTSESKPAL
jgi:GNAT superfamily N-acetyltransferase